MPAVPGKELTAAATAEAIRTGASGENGGEYVSHVKHDKTYN